MKPLLILFCFVLTYGQASSQSFIKTNPIRAFLGEVQFFYEKELKKANQAIDFKLGIVYPFSRLNEASSVQSKFGYFEYYDGLNKGVVLGAAFRQYAGNKEKRSFYYQIGMDLKFLRMTDVNKYIADDGTTNYTVNLDANHFVINPKAQFGTVCNGKFIINPYFGLGVSYRTTWETGYNSCYNPLNPSYCDRLKNNEIGAVKSPQIGPTIHLGILIGFRTSK